MKIKYLLLPFVVFLFSLISFRSMADSSVSDNSFVIVNHYTNENGTHGSSYYYDYYSSDPDAVFFTFIIKRSYSNFYRYTPYICCSTGAFSYEYDQITTSDQVTSYGPYSVSGSQGHVNVQYVDWYFDGSYGTQEVSFKPFGALYESDGRAEYLQAQDIYRSIVASGEFPDGGDGSIGDDGSIVPDLPDYDEWEPNYDIPNPVVSWNGDKGIGGSWALFSPQNAKPGYYIEARGAVYTFNDFRLVRKNLNWYNYYDSVYWLTNNGHIRWETYISPNDMQSAYVEGNISTGPTPALQVGDLQSLTSTGPYSVLNNLTAPDEVSKVGYASALGNMHNYPLVWVGHKIYLRYFTYVDGVVQYSKWTPYDFPPARSGSNAYTHLSEDPNIDEPDGGEGTDQDPNPDPDQPPDVDTGGGGDDGNGNIPFIDPVDGIFGSIVNWINNIIQGLNNIDNTVINFFNSSVAMLGQFPVLLSRTFQFLPSWLISAISIGLAISIILRVFGR